MSVRHEKMCNMICHWGIIKAQWDNASHFSRNLKADNNKCLWRYGAPGMIIYFWGLWNCTTTLESCVAIFYEVKYLLWLNNFTVSYLSRRMIALVLTKNVDKNVNSSFIHDSLRLEITQMSLKKRMNKKLKSIIQRNTSH